MATNERNPDSTFQWNAGAWFGGFHLGCTGWMLTGCGVSLFSYDDISAMMLLASFVIFNLIGLSIGRSRSGVTA